MCGRYSLFTEEESQEIRRIIKSLDAKYPGNNMKHGEIYPTDTAPILCQQNNEIASELSIWGFPRFGAKGSIINARSETTDKHPMFKKSLHTRRCVIPSTGFFEWSQNGSKTKYRLTFLTTTLSIWREYSMNSTEKINLSFLQLPLICQ